MSCTSKVWAPAAALCALTVAGSAQVADSAPERLDVSVSSANGAILVINRGLSSGIRKGDSVVFRRAGLPPLVGVVRRVDEREARVELEDLERGTFVAVGMLGEVLVPRGRAVLDGDADSTPEHPPWQEPVGTWAPGKPLLAPARSPAPEERHGEVNGRLFTRYQYTDDSEGDRTYARWWSGLDLDWGNPFERGGALRFKGDVSYRDAMAGGNSQDETLLRMQRFSYALGGNYGEPHRVEVGRFLSGLFPEFGLVDGVEYIRRLEGGDQVGASVGFLPDYQDDLAASDDLSTTVFYRWVDAPDERVSLGIGYQKTWHEGAADRDLFAGSAHWVIGPRTTFRGSLLVDYYDSSAQLESPGFQLTELHASLNQRLGDAAGVSLYASHFDWPELLKDDFPVPPPETISEQKLSRGGVSGWTRLAQDVRLYARLEAWSDEDRSGGYGDLRVDLRDLLLESSELSLGVFQTQGAFSDGLGARTRYTKWIGATALRLGYETVRYTQEGFLGEQSDLLQHLLRFGVDARIARDVDLSFDADQRFGDEQDALSVGLRLAWHF